MKRLQINLRASINEKETLLKAVNKLARETGRKGTMSEVVRHAIREYVNQEPEFTKSKN